METSVKILFLSVTLIYFKVQGQYGRSSYSFHVPVSGSMLNNRLKQRLASRLNTEQQARTQQNVQPNNPQESRISLTAQQLLKLDSLRLREQASSDSSRQSRTQEVGQSDAYLLEPTASGQPQRQRYQSIDDLRSQQSLLDRQELQLQQQRRQLQQQMSSYADDPYAQQQQQQQQQSRGQQMKNAQQRQQTRVSQKQQQRYGQDQFNWQGSNDPQQSYQTSQQMQYSDQAPNADLHGGQDRLIVDQASKQGQYSSRLQDQYGLDPSLQSVQVPKQSQYFSKSQPVNQNQFLIVSEHPQNTGLAMGGADQIYDRMSVAGQMNSQSVVDSGSSGYQSGPSDLRTNHMSSSSQLLTGGLSRSSGLQGEIQQQSIQQYISKHPSRSSVISDGGQQASGDQYSPGPQSSSVQSQMQGAYIQSVNQDMMGGAGSTSAMYDQHHPSLPNQGAVSGSTMGGATSGVVSTGGGSISGMGGSSSGMGGAVSGMGGATSGMASAGISTMGGATNGMGTIINTSPLVMTGTPGVIGGPVMMGGAGVMGGAGMMGHDMMGHGMMGHDMMGNAMMGHGMMGNAMMGSGMMGHGMMGNAMMGSGMMGHGMMGGGMMGGFFPFMDMESPDSPDPTPAPPAPPTPAAAVSSPAVVAPPPAVIVVSAPAVTVPPAVAVAVPAAVSSAPTIPPPSVNVVSAVASAAVVPPQAAATTSPPAVIDPMAGEVEYEAEEMTTSSVTTTLKVTSTSSVDSHWGTFKLEGINSSLNNLLDQLSALLNLMSPSTVSTTTAVTTTTAMPTTTNEEMAEAAADALNTQAKAADSKNATTPDPLQSLTAEDKALIMDYIDRYSTIFKNYDYIG